MVSSVSYRFHGVANPWGLVADIRLVPIPTYFSIGKNALPGSVQHKITESGGEVTDNLVFLGQLSRASRRPFVGQRADRSGRAGVLTTAQGLKVGSVGGVWNQSAYEAGSSTVSFL